MTEPYIGEIRAFPWDWSVRGWALCQGQLLPVAQNQALFALLGTNYGGNGVQTFGLPDLRSRVAVSTGTGPGLSNYVIGQKTGTETVTLNVTQLPAHNHLWQATTTDGNQPGAAGGYFATNQRPGAVGYVNTYAAPGGAQIPLGTPVVNTGGNQPHPNIQPYLCLNYSIALQGLFPSRN
jgi:microcystin-dependent protein